MKSRVFGLTLLSSVGVALSGCNGNANQSMTGSAAIVGSVLTGGASGKLADSGQFGCPNVGVALNNSLVSVQVADDCTFLIDDVRPAERVTLTVTLSDLGVSGTIQLSDVRDSELIEILVEADDVSLTISVLRRAIPERVDLLPVVIDANNVTVFLPASIYNHGLTVEGNNFTLVGEAGFDCLDSRWSVITGDVLILGNNATFRNILFEGLVEVRGNNANFINSCIGGELLIFGNNAEFNDDDDDGGDDDDGDDDDDDDDD